MPGIKELVEKEGLNNILILDKFRPLHTILNLVLVTSSEDEPISLPARITEERYKVQEGYKVAVKPLIEGFEAQYYYQSDFNSLVREGQIRVFIAKEVRF